MQFTVIDTQTGEYPELSKIARTEEWAKNLVYCDVDGFAISEDGCLMLMDDCGNCAWPPANRFIVKMEESDACVAETLNEEINDIVREVKAENRRLAAELEEAKRVLKNREGTWERIHEIDGQPTFSFWRCSNCHKAHYLEPPNADFCPACGAKMMGVEE
jgi:hypothetical protein